MVKTRKRKNSGKTESEHSQASVGTVAMEKVNKNDLEVAKKAKNTRKTINSSKLKQNKFAKKQSNVKSQTSAQFVEGEDVVDMYVEGDITSDVEITNNEETQSDLSEGELDNSHNQSGIAPTMSQEFMTEDEMDERRWSRSWSIRSHRSSQSHSVSRSTSTGGSQSDSSDSKYYELDRKRRKRHCKHKKHHSSVSDKLDHLTSAVFAMQDIMS